MDPENRLPTYISHYYSAYKVKIQGSQRYIAQAAQKNTHRLIMAHLYG